MYVAQTNVQLFRQMRELGYSDESLILAKDACVFASRAVSGRYRGSGKPFICHLVGTASILCELKQSNDLIVAAILHAMYLKQCDLGGAKTVKEKRILVKRKFGAEVENLVHMFHTYKWKYDQSKISEEDLNKNPEFRNVILLRVANELEDFLDGAILLHGKHEDDESTRKSSEWRLSYMKQCSENLIHAATYLGQDKLAESLRNAFEFTEQLQYPPEIKSGRHASFGMQQPKLRKLERISKYPDKIISKSLNIFRRLKR